MTAAELFLFGSCGVFFVCFVALVVMVAAGIADEGDNSDFWQRVADEARKDAEYAANAATNCDTRAADFAGRGMVDEAARQSDNAREWRVMAQANAARAEAPDRIENV
jgi:hypothetical protein